MEAKQNNKRFRKATALNDSGDRRYDHLLGGSGITDLDGQSSQQINYSAAAEFTVVPPTLYSQPQQQPTQTFSQPLQQQIQTFSQPLQQHTQVFPQQQQTFVRPSSSNQNLSQSPQQQTQRYSPNQYASSIQILSQSPQQQIQRYSPNQYAYQMMPQDSTLSIQNRGTTAESSTMIIDGENFRIIDEKPILEKLLVLETLITKLDEKFENLIKATAERSTHEDRLAENIESFHRDFQVWKETVNEDAFSAEFPLPLKKAEEVEVFDKKLASDNAFRILMVNIYIY